jgi:hypothetical protein
MANPLMLPTAAMLALVGAALGVVLGNGAINEINPVHFQTEESRSRFYSDLTPQGYRDWQSVQAAEFRAAESGIDLGSGCVGCRTYPEEYVPVHEASLGKANTAWAEVTEEVVEAPAVRPAVELQEHGPDLEQVERYAHFPVTAEEQQLALAEPPAGDETALAN